MSTTRKRCAGFSLFVLLLFAGCIVPDPNDPRTVLPSKGLVPPRTVAPGVKMTLAFETGSHPDPVFIFHAWSENVSGSTLYTRGTCYTPWSWELTREGKRVETGPPTANCQPISWAEFPAKANHTWSSGWNGSEWKPDKNPLDSSEGSWERAQSGDYVATIKYAFYRTQDNERYCCPEVAGNEIRFKLG